MHLLVLASGFGVAESTSTGCNRWLSLAEIVLEVPPGGRNCSLVASTSRCGEGISIIFSVTTSRCLAEN